MVDHIALLRKMRLDVQRAIAESVHRVRTNGDAAQVQALRDKDAALKAGIDAIKREQPNG